MKKEELKSIILEEAKNIKKLIEEKKEIEKSLEKLNKDNECEIEETTGKGHGINRRASHKGEIGKTLKKEEEVTEMIGNSHTASHKAGKKTTNPVYKKRREKKQINEEVILRNFVKKMLYKQYINEDTSEINNGLIEEEINEILKGYLESALWTEEERLNNETHYEDREFSIEDIDSDSKINAYSDIKKFIEKAGTEAINEAITENGLFKLGMDIWLTRNGHGAGFFDYSYENEEILMKTAKSLGSKYLYIGDDGKLYFDYA